MNGRPAGFKLKVNNPEQDELFDLNGVSVTPVGLELVYAAANPVANPPTPAKFTIGGRAIIDVSVLGTLDLSASGEFVGGQLTTLMLSADAQDIDVGGVTLSPGLMLGYTAATNNIVIESVSGGENPTITTTTPVTFLAGQMVTIAGASGLTGSFAVKEDVTNLTSFQVVATAPGASTGGTVSIPQQFTVGGHLTATIPQFSTTVTVIAGGTVENNQVTQFYLGLQSTGVEFDFAGVTFEPKSLVLTYASTGYTVSGQSDISVDLVGDSAPDFSTTITASGSFLPSGQIRHLGLSATNITGIGFNAAGVDVDLTTLSLAYDRSQTTTGISETLTVGGTAAIDLDLDSLGLTTSNNFTVGVIRHSGHSDREAEIIGLAYHGHGYAERKGHSTQTSRSPDPRFSYAPALVFGGPETFTVSGTASIYVGAQHVGVTLGTATSPGLVIKKTAGVAMLESMDLRNGNAIFQVGDVKLDAKDFNFKYSVPTNENPNGALSVGGTVAVEAGPIKIPAVKIPSIPISGGDLVSLDVRIPNLSFSLAEFGSLQTRDVVLTAAASPLRNFLAQRRRVSHDRWQPIHRQVRNRLRGKCRRARPDLDQRHNTDARKRTARRQNSSGWQSCQRTTSGRYHCPKPAFGL